MLAEEWEQIKLIFEAAVNVSQEQRLAYVDTACAGDLQRRAIVLELLGNHTHAGNFLEDVSLRIQHVFTQGDLIASRFRILRFISGGAMGEVYEAFDERLRVRLALKTLRPELHTDPQSLQRFEREIRIAREVSHENLCKVFDLVEHSDPLNHDVIVPCLTMQLIEGESLSAYLQSHRPLMPAEAIPLIRQIASAIDALHEHGIIHRDLKPSNVMLTTRGRGLRAVVTDFGLAKAALEAEFFESQVDFQAGAPYFMAPELLRGARPTTASDIYALGLIMDEMVTRVRAFPAESLQSLYYQKLWETPVPPTLRSSHLQPQWDRVILRCLAADPRSRYVSGGDAVAEIERAEDPASQEIAPLQTAVYSGRGRSSAWAIPLQKSTAALVMAGLLVILAFAGLLLQPRKTSVVVFPIDNLTSRPEYNYLCKGITAELMRRLTFVDSVQVIPYYEARAKVPPDQLKGRFSLEGLLQVFGGKARLTAQLTDNRNGTLVWSQNFDEEMQNPLQLQSDIAEGSVRALQTRTLFGSPVPVNNAGMLLPRPVRGWFGFQGATLPKSATTSAPAFDYYIRGRDLFEERTVPAALNAIQSFQAALREDPGFALAEAALADTQFVLMDYDYEPTSTLVARARDYAEEAIRINPNLAEAYTSLAAVRQTAWDFSGAEEAYRTALRLNPRFSQAHRWYAGLILQFGRYDEALAETRRAMELDPYDFPGQGNYGVYLYLSRRYAEAAAKLEETLSHKELINAHNVLGDVYLQLAELSSGRRADEYFAKALQQADIVESSMRRTMTESPAPSQPVTIKFADRMHAEYYSVSGHPERAQPYLERLIADTAAGRTSPVPLAMVYAVAGDGEKALPLLEQAAERKDRQLLYLKVSPQFDRLRQLPRFQQLLSRMRV